MAYDEVQAWKDNYDGMFARWLECDLERQRLEDELANANLRLRVLAQDAELLDQS